MIPPKPTRIPPLVPCLAIALGLAAVQTARATLQVYEGFSYTAGSTLQGRNGGTGFGSTTWQDNQNPVASEMDVIASGSLSHGNLLTTGNALSQTSAAAGGSVDSRTFTTIAGANAATTWLSFLVRMDGTLASDSTAWLGLRPNSTGEAPFLGVFTNASNEKVFGIGSNVAGSKPNVFSSISFAAEQTYLVVASITWNTASGGNELVKLFINPTLGGAAPTVADASRNDLNIATAANTNRLTSMELASGGNSVQWKFDEVRIGTTFADVTPVPEPATAATAGFVFALCAVRAVRRVRRRA